MAVDPQPLRVDIVSDVVCPWCVIGYYQLAQAARDTGVAVDIHWHPFELNPQMAPGGENLREHLAAKYGTTPEGSRKARRRLTELGAALGFAFDYADDMRMWNTFRAHQLIDWADAAGKAHAMKLALFDAYFGQQQNVSDIDALARIAGEVGLDPEAARASLESGERAEAVRAKERFWVERGVQGVPAMIFDRAHLATGAQGVETYARVLTHLATKAA